MQRAKCARGVYGCDRRRASQEAGRAVGAVAGDKGQALALGNRLGSRVDEPGLNIEKQIVERLFGGAGPGGSHAKRRRHFGQVWRIGLAASPGFAHPLERGAVDVEQLFVIRAADRADSGDLTDRADVHRQPLNLPFNNLGQSKAASGTSGGHRLDGTGFKAVFVATGLRLDLAQLACAQLQRGTPLGVARVTNPVHERGFVRLSLGGLAILALSRQNAGTRELGLHFVERLIKGGEFRFEIANCFPIGLGLDGGVVGFLKLFPGLTLLFDQVFNFFQFHFQLQK